MADLKRCLFTKIVFLCLYMHFFSKQAVPIFPACNNSDRRLTYRIYRIFQENELDIYLFVTLSFFFSGLNKLKLRQVLN